jgi:hypothetical protein
MKKRPWRARPSPKRAASPVSSSSDRKDTADAKAKLDSTKSDANGVVESTTTATTAYMILWCLHMLLPVLDGSGNGGLDLRPLIALDYSHLLPLVCFWLSLLFTHEPLKIPKQSLFQVALVAHAIDLWIRFQRMPFVWDHEYWGVLTGVTFLLAFLTTDVVSAERLFFRTARLQFCIFYTAATFWKFNTSFFDRETSCGTVLIMETVGAYIPLDLSRDGVEMIAYLAPWITVAGEATISITMLAACQGRPSATFFRDMAVMIGLLFHLTIFLLPVNSAGGFSLDCMSRFIFFFDSNEVSYFAERIQKDRQFLFKAVVWTLIVPPALIVLRGSRTGAEYDSGFAASGLLLVFYGLLIHAQPSATAAVTTPPPPLKTSLPMKLALILTMMYGFLGPILGVQQMGAPTMYSNLRYYGESNHYLVPTSILGPDILFGGGLVQVLASTSTALNERLAYIRSPDVFPARVLDLIQSARVPTDIPTQFFPLCMSIPHSRDILLEDYQQSNPLNGSGEFYPFVLPISTVRELLQKSVESGEEFVVTLVDAGTTSPSKALEVPTKQIMISTNMSCKIVEPNGRRGVDCREDGVARLLLDPPASSGFLAGVVAKLLVPYPSLVGLEEEQCMS